MDRLLLTPGPPERQHNGAESSYLSAQISRASAAARSSETPNYSSPTFMTFLGVRHGLSFSTEWVCWPPVSTDTNQCQASSAGSSFQPFSFRRGAVTCHRGQPLLLGCLCTWYGPALHWACHSAREGVPQKERVATFPLCLQMEVYSARKKNPQ